MDSATKRAEDAGTGWGNMTAAALRKIRFRCDFVGATITDVLKDRGWTQVEGEDDVSWSLFWCEVTKLRETMDARRLQPNQRIPHFRNHYELTRKNLLARNLKRFKRKNQRENRPEVADLCDCMPLTFEIPSEYLMFVEEYRKQPGGAWIVKPATGCQGRGIFLFNRLKDLIDWKKEVNMGDTAPNAATAPIGGEQELPEIWVVQRYLEAPYLLGGKKFDLRVYVLVTSFKPLKVWLARDGFARLSGYHYSLDSLSDNRVHLTNMAIQLKASSGEDKATPGSKWSLRRLRRYLTGRHGVKRVDQLLQDIAAIVMTSLNCVQSVIMNDKHCFELYGYDVLLDESLKPWLLEVNASPSLTATDPADYVMKYNLLQDLLNTWLLEVNASPSLTATDPADYVMKYNLLEDVLTIVDLEGRLSGDEGRVGGFDVIWNDGPVTLRCPGATLCGSTTPYVATLHTDRLNAHLGGSNNREEQLRQLKLQRYMTHVLATLPPEPCAPSEPEIAEEAGLDTKLYFELRRAEQEVWWGDEGKA